MSNDLLQTIEKKVQNAVETIELLRMEVNELKTANNTMKAEKTRWEEKLTELISKFESMENSEDSARSST